nr:hypothetical protein [Thiomonas sp.]
MQDFRIPIDIFHAILNRTIMEDKAIELNTITGEKITFTAQEINQLKITTGAAAELMLKSGRIILFKLTKENIAFAYEFLARHAN